MKWNWLRGFSEKKKKRIPQFISKLFNVFFFSGKKNTLYPDGPCTVFFKPRKKMYNLKLSLTLSPCLIFNFWVSCKKKRKFSKKFKINLKVGSINLQIKTAQSLITIFFTPDKMAIEPTVSGISLPQLKILKF